MKKTFSWKTLLIGLGVLAVGAVALTVAAPFTLAGYAALTTAGVGTGLVASETIDYVQDEQAAKEAVQKAAEREELKAELRAELLEELTPEPAPEPSIQAPSSSEAPRGPPVQAVEGSASGLAKTLPF